ncbi:hypothetical protein LCGC14_1211670 [marine sediment metagenome]|uniref:Uncharacterized protein n=1 Tax=marine sediment metagenome TaxID=412755 RepID=A0A0F9M190_9ZZZZ
MCIALISLASAVNIIAGESYSFQSEEFEYWEVVGNSSDMKGMNITWEDENITLTFDVAFAPDNFTLIFFNNETQIITEHHYSSSGGSRTKYIDRNITREIDKIIYINQTIDKEIDEDIEEEPRSFLTEILGTVIGLLIVGFVYLISKIRQKKKVLLL